MFPRCIHLKQRLSHSNITYFTKKAAPIGRAKHGGRKGNQSGAQCEEASNNPIRYDLPKFILKQNTTIFQISTGHVKIWVFTLDSGGKKGYKANGGWGGGGGGSLGNCNVITGACVPNFYSRQYFILSTANLLLFPSSNSCRFHPPHMNRCIYLS